MARKLRVSGTVEEEETGRPLPELVVRAYDRDLVFDDLLGFDTTDERGCFEIRFQDSDFKDLLETRPDIYVRIYDRSGRHLLRDTRKQVRRNASDHEVFHLTISGGKLRG